MESTPGPESSSWASCRPLGLFWSHLGQRLSDPQSSAHMSESPSATAANPQSTTLPCPSPWPQEPLQTQCAPVIKARTDRENRHSSVRTTEKQEDPWLSFLYLRDRNDLGELSKKVFSRHWAMPILTSGTGSKSEAFRPGVTLGR